MQRNVMTATLSLVAVLAGTAAAQLGASADGTIYRLNDDATHQRGCFPPCLCPLLEQQPVVGVFVLGPRVIGDAVDFHKVREINWRVGNDNSRFRITGSGMYRVTNFGKPVEHALDLDLSIDGAEPVHFFSDFVPVTSNDGAIDIPISMNGVFCYDVVIRVSASPVRPHDAVPYALERRSTFQRGCFDPCDCPLEEPRRMVGRFALVQVTDFGTVREYALVGARFAARPTSNVDGYVKLNGYGWYTRIDGVAGPIHALDLTMGINGQPPDEFDGGPVNTHPNFPAFYIVVDKNDQVCYDIVLSLDARPIGGNAVLTDH